MGRQRLQADLSWWYTDSLHLHPSTQSPPHHLAPNLPSSHLTLSISRHQTHMSCLSLWRSFTSCLASQSPFPSTHSQYSGRKTSQDSLSTVASDSASNRKSALLGAADIQIQKKPIKPWRVTPHALGTYLFRQPRQVSLRLSIL